MIDILYDKTLKCLYCDNKFITKKVRQSRLAITKKDSDFCNHYTGENPYFYEVNICPKCGLAFTENFAEIKPAKKDILEKEYFNRIEIKDFCGPRSLEEALICCKLGLLCANFLEEPKTSIAGLLMRIAWMYRYQDNKEVERKYLTTALSVFETVYMQEDLDTIQMGKTRLLYLIAELHGRLDNFEETRRWFNMLFSEKNIEPALKKLARDQWDEYKMAHKSS